MLYFDYNATTPLAPEVKTLLKEAIDWDLKNPSSVHQEGRKARKTLEEAREGMAALFGCDPQGIIFTSGATESHNHLFETIWKNRPRDRDKIIISVIEHTSVTQPLEALKLKGAKIVEIPVDSRGVLDGDAYCAALDEHTLLVSMMLANNETGMILPIPELSKSAYKMGVKFHADAVCAVGKIPLSMRNLNADYVTLSAHKFYGPKGMGALLMGPDIDISPFILGGSQEGGRRSGTENLLGILGMAWALEFALRDLDQENARLLHLRKKLKEGLQKIADVVFHESDQNLVGTVNVAFPGHDGQNLLVRLDLEGVCASYGSACHSGTLEVSKVLLAMGYPAEEARSSIRISFGRMTTEEDVARLLEVFKKVLD